VAEFTFYRPKATITSMPSTERVALGLRAHSGSAVLVALRGPGSSPAVVDRRRLTLCDDSFPRQPYHAAEDLPIAEAEALVSRSLETAARLARAEIKAAVEARRAAGQRVAGVGLLLGSGRPLPKFLSVVLGSHPLIHTAEGEMYRSVLRDGCERAGIEVVGLREREILASACERLELSPEALRARIAELGKPLGPPWTQDEKLASLAAWLVLRGAKK
jgi:hypothetical protein